MGSPPPPCASEAPRAPLRIVLMGTPALAAHILDKLNSIIYFLDISEQFLLPHPLRSDFPPHFIPLLLILRTC